MGTRRRYDTEALVGKMRAERRTGLLLSLVGVLILCFLLGLYITGLGTGDIPTVPARPPPPPDPPAKVQTGNPSPNPDAKNAEEPSPASPIQTADSNGSEAQAPAEPPEEAKKPDSRVRVSFSSGRGWFWLDGKKIGRFRRRALKMAPGEHRFKTRYRRRVIEQRVTIAEDTLYDVVFDAKKKKFLVRKR